MAEDIATLGIKVESRDIVKATKNLDKLEKQSKQNTKEAKKLSGAFSGLGTVIGGLGLGLAFKSIISLSIEQERAVRQLDAAIKSTGGTAGFTTQELQEMAASLQGVTNYGDEAILSMQSILLTFTNLQGDILPATTEATLDLAERMGTDLKSAAVQLGKALNDPVANLSALSRSGIQFSKDQKEMIKGLVETNRLADAQAIILEELSVQFGGSAKAARDTFGGALKSLGNAIGDLMEGEDGNLNEAKKATEELIKVLQAEGTKEAFASLTAGIIGVTSAIVKGIVALNDFGESIGKNLADLFADKTPMQEVIADIEQLERLQKKAAIGSDFWVKATDRLTESYRKLAELRKERGITGTDGGGADAPVDEGDGEASRAEKLKQIELERIAEMEMDAMLDKAIREQEEMERLSDYHDQKLALEMDYYDRLYNMQAGSQQAALSFTDSIRMNDYKGAVKHGALMLSNAAKTNKTAFEAQKAFSLANAAVSLPSAVLKSFENGGGYPWGLIPAGLMLAQGLQQINSIRSASFGGGGGTPSVGGGGSTSPSAPVASGLPEGATAIPDSAEQPKAQQVSITLEGAGYSKENVRELIVSINEEIGDGAELMVTA